MFLIKLLGCRQLKPNFQFPLSKHSNFTDTRQHIGVIPFMGGSRTGNTNLWSEAKGGYFVGY